MALIDNQNKVVYWDEVNWQWLPFVKISNGRALVRVAQQNKKLYKSVNSKEHILSVLEEEGYSICPLSELGIVELFRGCYLYNGKVYKKEGSPIKSLPSLLSLITGMSFNRINKQLKGFGVMSKKQINKLVLENSVIIFQREDL